MAERYGAEGMGPSLYVTDPDGNVVEIKGVPENRARIIACRGNFHGRTIAVIAMSSEDRYRHNFGPFPPGFDLVEFGEPAALEAAITPPSRSSGVSPIKALVAPRSLKLPVRWRFSHLK